MIKVTHFICKGQLLRVDEDGGFEWCFFSEEKVDFFFFDTPTLKPQL